MHAVDPPPACSCYLPEATLTGRVSDAGRALPVGVCAREAAHRVRPAALASVGEGARKKGAPVSIKAMNWGWESSRAVGTVRRYVQAVGELEVRRSEGRYGTNVYIVKADSQQRKTDIY